MTEQGPLSLYIPRQDLPEFIHFGLNDLDATQWAEGLPLADTGQSVRLLRAALGDLNRVEMAPELRFEIMEALRPSLHTALSALSRDYLNQPLVPPKAARKASGWALDLLEQAATAYTIAAVHAIQGRGRRSQKRRALLVRETLHRAITCAGMKLLVFLQLYRPVEPNTWARLHRLFLVARRQKLESLSVGDNIAGDGSIRDTYLRAVMLGCCGSNQLRQFDLAAVFGELRAWAGEVELSPAEDGKGLFLLDPGRDQPPVYTSLAEGTPGLGSLVINTERLVSLLRRAGARRVGNRQVENGRATGGENVGDATLADRNEGLSPSALSLGGLSRGELSRSGSSRSGSSWSRSPRSKLSRSKLSPGVLEHLANAWGEMHSRGFARTGAAPGEQLRLAVGLGNTHICVSAGEAPEPHGSGGNGGSALDLQGSAGNAPPAEGAGSPDDGSANMRISPGDSDANMSIPAGSENGGNGGSALDLQGSAGNAPPAEGAGSPDDGSANMRICPDDSDANMLISTGSGGEEGDSLPAHWVDIIDAGPGGYCLRRPANLPGDTKTGDVVGLFAGGGWSIGVIRWVGLDGGRAGPEEEPGVTSPEALSPETSPPGTFEQGTFPQETFQSETLPSASPSATPSATLMGVELLSAGAIPCGARTRHRDGQEGDIMRVLLLPGIELAGQPETLLTPAVGFRDHQQIRLVRGDEELRVELVRTVASTAACRRFEFREVRRTETADTGGDAEPAAGIDSPWNHI